MATSSVSKSPTRNPILQTDLPSSCFRPSRKPVASHKASGLDFPERPTGIAKGTFSLKNMGSISLSQEEQQAVRPVRMREQREAREPPRKKTAGHTPQARNPITQEDVRAEVQRMRSSTTLSWRPSQEAERLGNKRYLMPSDQRQGRAALHRDNLHSEIFTPGDAPVPKLRRPLEKPSEAARLLHYDFAPDFSPQRLSANPQRQLLTPQSFSHFRVDRNQAELFRLRMTQSTLKFS